MYCSGISFVISADTRSMVLALCFVSVNNAQYHSDKHCVIYDPWPHCYRFECGCLFLATRVDLGQLWQNCGGCITYSGIQSVSV